MADRVTQHWYCVLAAGALCTSRACAGFAGLTIESPVDHARTLTDGESVFMTQWFVHFSDADDRLIGISEAKIFTDASGGWYQHPQTGSLAPTSDVLFDHPEAQYDSFVAIGAQFDDSWTTFDTDWNPDAFTAGGLVGGWFNANPDNGMGNPDEDGRVFAAQLAMLQPGPASGYFGDLVVLWQDGETPNVNATHVEVFYVIPGPSSCVFLTCASMTIGRTRSREHMRCLNAIRSTQR